MIGLIGGLGSIGSRYAAVLRWMDTPYVVIDSADQQSMEVSFDSIDRFIICTPTETHLTYCKLLINQGKKFLCEKPLSKDLFGCKEIMDYPEGYVVNNYAWTFRNHGIQVDTISYDYFRTGKDGLLWDCAQLIYMDPKAKIKNESPVYELTVNGQYPIDLREVEQGYVQMLHFFANCDECHGMWTLEDGYLMSCAVAERIERENGCFNPSEK